jgi:hypothetical protein
MFLRLRIADPVHKHILDALTVKAMLVQAITNIYGLVGSATFGVDVLSVKTCEEGGAIAIVCCAFSALVPVRSACSLLGSFNKVVVAIHTEQVSPFLSALAHSSRT